MDQSNHINRKEAIKRAGLLLGGVVYAPNILGVLNGCTATPGMEWNPVLFSQKQAKLVTALADTILPADEHPSASQVGVPAFIESMVNEVYTEEQRNSFIDGLNTFAEDARVRLGTEFIDSDEEQKYNFTLETNETVLSMTTTAGPPFFLRFKELTILGYFTSETGATEVLRYEPIPGRYDGCIPFDDVGKTWAT